MAPVLVATIWYKFPSVNAVVSPTHTSSVPLIVPGTGFTVTTAVTIQPVPNVGEVVKAMGKTKVLVKVSA